MSGYMYNVNAIKKLSDQELSSGSGKSWHDQYSDSAWVFVGGLPYELTEGDVLCVFSQYGEIVNINMVRDKKTGKPKGFAFICYENQKSTVLAVDNFNGVKIKGRTIRVDHVANYRVPKEHEDDDNITRQIRQEGVAPKTPSGSEEEEDEIAPKKAKKEKKKKQKSKKKKDKDKERGHSSASSKSHSHTAQSMSPPVSVKKEKDDPGYKVAELGRHHTRVSDTHDSREGGKRRDGVKEEGYDFKKQHITERQNRESASRQGRREDERNTADNSRDARDSGGGRYSHGEEGRHSRHTGPDRHGSGRDVREAKGQMYPDSSKGRHDRDRNEGSRESRDQRDREDRNARGSVQGKESRGTGDKEGRRERDGHDDRGSGQYSEGRGMSRGSYAKESTAASYSDPWDRGHDKDRRKERMDRGYEGKDRRY